jgi:peptidoglycan/LPS O-acetylase OafA/YrhL
MQMPLQATGNHFWSVNAEEQFYLLSPLLIVLAPKLGKSPLLWASLASLALVSGNMYGGILMGVLAATVVSKYGAIHLNRHAQFFFVGIAITCTIGLVFGGSFYFLAPLFGTAAVLLLASPGKPSFVGKIAGGMSYPLYLNHWIGVFVGNALLSPFGLRDSPARQVFACLFSIALAICLYWFVDRELLKRREFWYGPTIGRHTRLAAYLMIGIGVAFGLIISLISR